MSLFPETRFEDWTRADARSFAKRYFEPLWRVARLDFRGLSQERAQDLAQSFLLRELERDADEGEAEPVFARFEVDSGHSARFRTYLRTCFFRFARDELRKEQRRSGPSLDEVPEAPSPETERAFQRLVARDTLRSLRAQVLAGDGLDEAARAYFALKWPDALDDDPLSDAEAAKRLELTRGRLRTLKRKVVERILLVLRRRLHDDGLRLAAADAALQGYAALLGDEA